MLFRQKCCSIRKKLSFEKMRILKWGGLVGLAWGQNHWSFTTSKPRTHEPHKTHDPYRTKPQENPHRTKPEKNPYRTKPITENPYGYENHDENMGSIPHESDGTDHATKPGCNNIALKEWRDAMARWERQQAGNFLYDLSYFRF